jgi:aryl-alcohol dehydrogenase-like predicted oxidoreductase
LKYIRLGHTEVKVATVSLGCMSHGKGQMQVTHDPADVKMLDAPCRTMPFSWEI